MAERIMSQAIAKAVAEATRVAIQTMVESQAQGMPSTSGPKPGNPILKQPNFSCEASDKYTEWKAFILEVRNMLSTYNAQEIDKIVMVKDWLGRKGLHYIESLTEGETETCSVLEGLFDTLATKFKPQYNKMIKLLQFRKLYRFEGEGIDEWMGRLCVVVVECNYREIDRQLKGQFIHGLNDKVMIDEVIREPTAKNNDEQTTNNAYWDGASE